MPWGSGSPFASLFHVFLLFTLLVPAALHAQQSRVLHTPPPPSAPGARITITFRVEGDDRPVAADLSIRRGAGEAFQTVEAIERGGIYRADIPVGLVEPPGFEYFISVRTESGIERTSPSRDPRGEPHRIAVSAEQTLDRIVVLTPEPDGVVESADELLISALFDPPIFPPATAILFLDGREISDSVEITEDYLLYQPKESPERGAHELLVVLLDENGSTLERSWTFFFREFSQPRRLTLSGKMEAGWASVTSRDVVNDPYLPYDETSSLRFDMYAYGDWSGRALYFSGSRDPIYDDEIRFAGRIAGEHFKLEAGDIYPSFSELSVSWLSGEGALLSLNAGALQNEVFLVRTIHADTTGGFGTYSQFIGGNRTALRAGRFELGANVAYGWERERSVEEEFRFLIPISNLVGSASCGFAVAGEARLDFEGGWSDTEGDDTTTAGAVRTVLTLLDSPDRRLLAEFHNYDSGYYALGSPTVDSGERGFLLDGSLRLGRWLRQSARMEFYRDGDSSQDLEADANILQFYGRTDLDWAAGGVSWNPYLLFRTYEIPYETDQYTSRYGTVGLFARRSEQTLSLNVTRSVTRSTSDTDSWTASGNASGSLFRGKLTWKLGERYSRTSTEGEIEEIDAESGSILDVTEGKIAEEERWTFSTEATLRAAGLEWRAEYERLDENDPIDEAEFTQHLLSIVTGVRF